MTRPPGPSHTIARVAALAARVADRRFGRRDAGDDGLARAVAAVSAVYTRERDRLAAGPETPAALEARLRFFLPRDVPKVIAPLAELSAAGALPPGSPWRVLDLGAGLGTATLAAGLVAEDLGRGADVLAVDRDPRALDVLCALALEARSRGLPRLAVTRRAATLALDRAPPGEGPFDLVILSLTLNELLEPLGEAEAAAAGASFLARLVERLTPDGALVVVEPALRATSRRLQRVRDAVIAGGGGHVFAPCQHEAPCPMLAANERDWCHEAVDAALPPALSELARRAGLRDHRATFSALVLRRRPRVAPALLRVVSAPRRSKGRADVFVCGEDRLTRIVRLDRHDAADAPPIGALARGDLARLVERDAGASTGRDVPVARVPDGKPLPATVALERVRAAAERDATHASPDNGADIDRGAPGAI